MVQIFKTLKPFVYLVEAQRDLIIFMQMGTNMSAYCIAAMTHRQKLLETAFSRSLLQIQFWMV